jgi:hypothetical protein
VAPQADIAAGSFDAIAARASVAATL